MGSEVLIIGGGVIGLSIARELHKKGTKGITILEKGRCGEEASWAAAGMLSPQVEADTPDAFFRFCCASRDLYPEFAAELSDETCVDIELDQTGTIHLAFEDISAHRILDRFRWQRDAGLAIESLSAEEVLRLEPQVSSLVRTGVLFPNDWRVENRKLVSALRKYLGTHGVSICEETEVTEIVSKNGCVTGARTTVGTHQADQVILATGAWTSFIKLGSRPMPFEIKPVRGQIVVFRPKTPLFEHVLLTDRGYLVPRRDGRILGGSTSEDVGFDRSVTSSAAEELRDMADEIVAGFATMQISDQWAGLRPFVRDGLPVIGRVNDVQGLTIATGHYRNGILLAPLTARLVADLVVDGVRSKHLDAFNPERFLQRGVVSS